MRGKDDKIVKIELKITSKYGPLTLLGVNHCQPILHMSKILVYIYTTYERINKFLIGYMINPTLHVNKVFREQVEKLLRDNFYQNTMEYIKMLWEKGYMYYCTNNFYDSLKKSNKSV